MCTYVIDSYEGVWHMHNDDEIIHLAKKVDWSKISNGEIVIVDVETTGFDANTDQILEIGCIRCKTREGISRFSTLINTHQIIPEEITKLTGIDDALIKEQGVPFYKALGDFKAFIRGSDLNAYNANFDKKFLQAICKERNVTLSNYFSDSMLLCRKAFKTSGSKLKDVAEHLGYDHSGGHRALFDCELTLKCHLQALIHLDGQPTTANPNYHPPKPIR